jgi:hypothetical protein
LRQARLDEVFVDGPVHIALQIIRFDIRVRVAKVPPGLGDRGGRPAVFQANGSRSVRR